jgi:hypothetical protein
MASVRETRQRERNQRVREREREKRLYVCEKGSREKKLGRKKSE